MAYLLSLPAGAVLLDVFRADPQTARVLLDYHRALLPDPAPRSPWCLDWRGRPLRSGPSGDSEPELRRAVTPINVCPTVISGSYRSGPVHDPRRQDGRRFAG
jgi:hypothetical protein